MMHIEGIKTKAREIGWTVLDRGHGVVRFEKGFSDRAVIEARFSPDGRYLDSRAFIISDDGAEIMEDPLWTASRPLHLRFALAVGSRQAGGLHD